MTRFIMLHRWVSGRAPSLPVSTAHGSPVWVNPAMITQICQYEGVVVTPDGPALHQDRPREMVTSISFPAGMQEETDGVSVIETPDEIFEIIAADDRLKAASLDLLKALRQILWNDGGAGSNGYHAIRHAEAREAGYAAIARAEGK